MTSLEQVQNENIRTLDANIMSLEEVELVLKALGSVPRMQIIEHLSGENFSINELAEALDIPPTTVAMHINILEEAGFVRTELVPASRGRQKVCARSADSQLIINLPRKNYQYSHAHHISMPVGAYTDCAIVPTCGLASATNRIGSSDNVSMFYHPQRFLAQLVWFKQGFVEYRFPSAPQPHGQASSIQFSLELCSEAPNHDDDWPSDITLWVNGIEIGTWTSPSDFGGERGIYTPDWWGEQSTQYGVLKTWRTTHEGSFVDGIQTSAVTIDDLNLDQNSYIAMRIGIKADANHIGGINIFGQHFGNYPQDIVMRINYEGATVSSM